MDFACEERRSQSRYVDRVWRFQSQGGGRPFLSVAEVHFNIVVTTIRRKTTLTVRGPETQATAAYCPPDAEFVGIMFKLGAFMPTLPPSLVKDRRDVNLPEATSRSFWLDSSAWNYPTYENAETFVEGLVRRGLLVHVPTSEAVLEGQPTRLLQRTVQRRFLHTTGLTWNLTRQIVRARTAVTLLRRGLSILEVVQAAGYFDQPHLTRSLKRFVGLTPGQVSDPARTLSLSLLYKTPPHP